MPNRTRSDILLKQTKALPAAGASASTDSVDLVQANAYPVNESFDVKVSVPATPDLVDTKIITFTIEDSADDSSFAAVTGLSTLTVTADGDGGAAAERIVKLPGSARRYVRATADVPADGGDNTAVEFALEILT